MEGWGHREEEERIRDSHGEEEPKQGFCFLAGQHANTLERIVQLREIKKKEV